MTRGPSFDGYRPTQTNVLGIDLRCTAKNRHGEQCKNRVLPGYEVCRPHKEHSERLRGPNNPNATTGRYARLLPPDLQQRYDAAANDPDLLKVESEIRLVDARLQQLASKLDAGESGALWANAKATLREVTACYRRRAYGEAVPLLLSLQEQVTAGVAEHMAWDELGRWLDRRKQLVESERRRLVELQQYVPAQRVQVVLSAIGAIIQTHVTDPATLSAIAAAIARLDAGAGLPIAGRSSGAFALVAREE